MSMEGPKKGFILLNSEWSVDMKTKILITISILVLVIISVVVISPIIKPENTIPELQSNLAELQIDQGDTFIAISSNDTDGYNRWIPFYFHLQTESDDGIEAVEAFLNETFTEATLYSNSGDSLFTTEELIWSAFRLDTNSYNLTLVIVPDLQDFVIDELIQINKIALSFNNEAVEYMLPNYTIEARDTIKDDLYVAVSTMETEFQDNLIARVNYGIMGNTTSVESLELDYPTDFANIEKYEIDKINESADGVKEYSMIIHFSAPNNKIVFRPFIKILYSDNNYEWVIPTVPAYIN